MTWVLVFLALALSIAGVAVTWVRTQRIDWIPIIGSVVLIIMALGLRGRSGPRR
jgi:cytochrome c biogenesis protein CcdA